MNWTILALLMMIPGAAGLGLGTLEQRTIARQTAHAAQAISDAPSAEEYLAMYEQWSQLTPVQKGENPWGQGCYGGPEIQKRLREDRSLRFEADLPDLVAGLKSYPQQLADVLYGSDWAPRLTQFQQQREHRDLAMTVAAIAFFAGALLFCGGLIKWIVTAALCRKKEGLKDKKKSIHPAKKLPDEATVKTFKKATESSEVPVEKTEPAPQPSHPHGYFGAVMKKKEWPDPAETGQALPVAEVLVTTVSETCLEPSGEAYFGWATEPEDETSGLMTTEPVTRGLSELTEEVSAIRQYATAQQSQMQKLQDGYDWMLIRRFCLRIIRCIDNLNDRIVRVGQQNPLAPGCLEEIRDELVFALESSGVEQYQPDLNVQFKGLEKYAEAVRQRVPASDASQVGTIAEILRPGYQYLISDDDVKIVRCAQVKLYDIAEPEV